MTSLPTDLVRVSSSQFSPGFAYGIQNGGALVSFSSWYPAPGGVAKVREVSVGSQHACAVGEDGTVVCWGGNDFGQTTVPPGLSNVAAVACGGLFTIALRHDGSVVHWGNDLAITGVPIRPTSGIRAIAAGGRQAIAVRMDGTVMGWGEAVISSDLVGVAKVSIGARHGLALLTNGQVAAWGDNASGQALVPPDLAGAMDVQAGYDHSLARMTNGSIVCWGGADAPSMRVPAGLSNVVALAGGWGHSIALRAGPVLVVGPSNVIAEAGANIAFNVVVAEPVRATYQWQFEGADIPGANASTLIVTNVQTQDLGEYGVRVRQDGFEIGASARLWFGSAPTILLPPANAWIFAGQNISFEVQATNVTKHRYQWLFDSVPIAGATNNVLSLSNVQPAQAGRYLIRVISDWGPETTAGATLEVVVSTSRLGDVVSWGALTNTPPGISGVISIASGDGHTLALRGDGTVTAWGDNSYGQTAIPAGLRDVIAIAAGGRHNLALRRDGRIVGWGHNYNGQAAPPAITDFIAVGAGNAHSLGVRAGGSVVAWGNGTMGATLPPPLTNAVAVAAGGTHSLALTRDGTISSWGDSGAGLPDPAVSNVVAIAAGHVLSAAVRLDGSLYLVGQSSPPSATSVVSIAVNYDCVVAARSDGSVVSWGGNSIPPSVPLSNVIAVAAGPSHRAALRENGIFIASSPSNVTALLGTAVEFSAHAISLHPLTYQWRSNGVELSGETNRNLRLAAITRSSAGVYWVEIRSPLGSAMSAPATLTVLSPPEVAVAPRSQSVAAGSNVVFSVEAVGSPPLRYLWYSNGIPIPNATRANLVLQSVAAAAAADYRVRITNNYGMVTSAVATLTVNYPPSLTLHPVSGWTVLGSSTQFSVAAQGTGPLTYEWYFDGLFVPSNNLPWLNLTNVQLSSGGDYLVRVSNPFGVVTSLVAHLDVVPATPQIVSHPISQTQALGSVATFSVQATGLLPLSYEWRQGSISLSGATNATLVIPDVDLNSEGEYSVTVRNGAGVATSAMARLSIRLRPNVIAWGANTEGQTQVPPDLTNAIAIAAGWNHCLAVRADGSVVAWGSGVSGKTSVPPGLTGVVAVSAGEAHSLALRTDGTVVGWGDSPFGAGVPPVGLSNVSVIVAGSLHSLALQRDGRVVGWGYNGVGVATPPGGLSNVVGLAAGYEHCAAVRQDGTIVDWGNYYGDTRRFTNVLALSGSGLHFAALLSDGTALDWGAPNYASTNVVANNAVAVAAGPAPVNSPGHGLALTRQGTIVGWGDNSAGQSIPPLDLPSAVAVAAGHRFSLALIRAGQFVVQPVGQSVSEGDQVVFRATAVAEGDLRYQWTHDKIPIPGGTNSTLVLTNLVVGQTGDYQLLAINAYGIAASRQARLTVNPRTPLFTRQPLSRSVLAGEEEITFEVDTIGPAPRFQWRHNGEHIPGSTNRTLTIANVAFNDAGAYTAVAVNENGQTISEPAVLIVRVADLVIDNPGAIFSGLWQSDSTPSGRYGVDVRWTATGTEAADARFTPTLPRAGDYRIYEWHPAAATYASAARHIVSWNGGTNVVAVNQRDNGAGWNLLGQYAFARGAAASVRISNSAGLDGIVVADAIKFEHVPAPPVIVVPPTNQIVPLGGMVALACIAHGSEPLRYQWQHQGSNVPHATNQVLRIESVQRADEGAYLVLVSNADGTEFSSTAQLVVAAPALRLTAGPGGWRLMWPPGFQLQWATNVGGPYQTLLNATNPYLLGTEYPQGFFRLRD